MRSKQRSPSPARSHGGRGCLSAVAVLAVAVTVITAVPAAAFEVPLRRVETYIPDFPVKRKMNLAYRPELDRIREQMQRRMKDGENLICTAEIFQEVHWLVNYTDRVDDIERRIGDLRASLVSPDRRPAGSQDPTDGSFGACFETWIWRFFSSVDPLKEMARRGETPAVPLKIWEPVDTPEEIVAVMRDLLVSDVDGGRNKRKELNMAITALGQLLWLDYTAAVFPPGLDREALAASLRRFVDDEWQNPETGYWGAWYQDGDGIEKTQDLSITFHILSYRGGEVNLLREIGRTTFAIRHVKYPYGWDSGGTQNNHHVYDVARIINLTWDQLGETEKANARALMFLISARSLNLSIDDDGFFVTKAFTTVGEAYYFGISFFDEIRLFVPGTPDSLGVELTNTEGIADTFRRHLQTLDRSDPWVAAAERKLDDAERR